MEWSFYAQSASEAIFRARAYNLFSPVMMITWWMKLGGNLPPGHDALLFSRSGTGSCICPHARLDIPRPLFTQSWTTGGMSNRRSVGPQWNTPTTRLRWPPQVGGSIIPRVLNGGIFSLLRGSSAKTAPPRVCHPHGAYTPWNELCTVPVYTVT